METTKQGVLLPSETKHARSTQEPEKAGISQETSCCRHGWRGGWGWEGGQWQCPHHLRGSTSFPVHFQRRAGNTEHCSKPSPLQEPLAWDEHEHEMLNSLPARWVSPCPKGGHCFIASTASEISPFIYMQMVLCSCWQLFQHPRNTGWSKNFFLLRVRIDLYCSIPKRSLWRFFCQNRNIMVLQALLSLPSAGRYPWDRWAQPLQHVNYPVSTVSQVEHTAGTSSHVRFILGTSRSGPLALRRCCILPAQGNGDGPSHFWCQKAEVLLGTSAVPGLCSRTMSPPRLKTGAINS